MADYLMLIRFTEKGLREVADSPQRAKAFRKEVEAAGGKVRELLWTVGAFDGAVVFEAPDEATATALVLALGCRGNVRTESLRAFGADEFARIAGKVKAK